MCVYVACVLYDIVSVCVCVCMCMLHVLYDIVSVCVCMLHVLYDIVSVCVCMYVLCVCVCVCYVFVYMYHFLCFFAFVDPLFEELGILTDLSCCFHYSIFYSHLLIVIYIILQ